MSLPLPDDHERLPPSWGEAWRSDEAERSDVQRAYLRFSRRRHAKQTAAFAPAVRWVLLGVLIGAGSVYAATGVTRLFEAAPAARASSVPPTPKLTRRDLPSGAPEPEAPSVLLPQLAERSEPARPTASSVARERWQRAARGLRGEDFESAHAALEELARDGDHAERESARLVQAQLFISQGQVERARPLLQQLRESARSPSVQQKVDKLLLRIDQPPPSQRSF